MKFGMPRSEVLIKILNTISVSLALLSAFAPATAFSDSVRKLRINAMSGYSTFAFSMNGEKRSSGANLIGKVQASYLLGNTGLDLSSTAYMGLKTLSSSSGDDVSLINSNLSISYTPRIFRGSWKASLSLGLNFAAIAARSDSFGLKDVFGPSALIRVAKGVRKKDTISSFVKFTGVLANSELLSLSESRELTFGLAYHLGFGSRYSISLQTEYFSQAVTYGGSQVNASGITIGLGFGI